MTATENTARTNGYLLHIGPVEIVQHLPGGRTIVRTERVEAHPVASRYVIDFRRVLGLEVLVGQNRRLIGFSTNPANSAIGAKADQARLDAELDRMAQEVEAMRAFGAYRAAKMA